MLSDICCYGSSFVGSTGEDVPLVVVDPGSCHMNNFVYCKEFVDIGKKFGVSVKFQLFNSSKVNIPLSHSMFEKVLDYGRIVGVDVFASVFDMDSIRFLNSLGVSKVKIGFSKRYDKKLVDYAIRFFDTVFISGDVMTCFPDCDKVVKLFCIPEYPVKYLVDFENVFDRFDGFSDHTLGIKQTVSAVENGARVIEKHITLDYGDIVCPDNHFALSPSWLRALCLRLGVI